MKLYTVAGRRIVIHTREEWQNPLRPVTGPAPLPELVHHFVVHWPGASDNWKPDADVAAHLRWAQDMDLLDPKRGYSYGYGFVIGPNLVDWTADPIRTDIWEVRGFDIRIASNNGDFKPYSEFASPNFNGRSISAQIMASTNFAATTDQLTQAAYLVALADQVYGETLEVIPHRTSDATSCPGDFIASRIPAIATRPTPPPPPPDEEDELTEEDIERIAVRLGLVDSLGRPTTVGDAVWRTQVNTADPSGTVGKFNMASVVGWTWNKVRGL